MIHKHSTAPPRHAPIMISCVESVVAVVLLLLLISAGDFVGLPDTVESVTLDGPTLIKEVVAVERSMRSPLKAAKSPYNWRNVPS